MADLKVSKEVGIQHVKFSFQLAEWCKVSVDMKAFEGHKSPVCEHPIRPRW